ncbi:hypothetical protein BDQ12DRAFT_735106 [Crucibulum laeve]|uniref:Uncharacterized protein n=1 Tax=Crucibulum laeve TaxID=68775 RepID=A0A5C3MCI4_9AGAR|nr:hypothetical protein BDQ12DRAFT_735106 [Crucibulum laeve]
MSVSSSFDNARQVNVNGNSRIVTAGGSVVYINLNQPAITPPSVIQTGTANSLSRSDDAGSTGEYPQMPLSRPPLKSNNPFRPDYLLPTLPSPLELATPESDDIADAESGYFSQATSVNQESSRVWEVESQTFVPSISISEPRVALTSTREEISTSHPPIATAFNSSCKIYVDHMLRHRHGFPLWLPQPDLLLPLEYREEGINIGDVGIITPDGGFDFLFNFWLPRTHPVQPLNLPEDFDLWNLDRPEKSTSRQTVFDPCSSVCSGAVVFDTNWEQRRVSTLYAFPVRSKIRRFAHYREASFACTSNEGAILSLPEGSITEDLKNEQSLIDFVVKSAESWYAYAKGPGGRPIDRNSLYIITGIMKAPFWGIATYNERFPEPYNRLRFGQPLDTSIRRYIWKESGGAIARTGPSQDPEVPSNTARQNQCLFVRGFKIALSEDAWSSVSNLSSPRLDIRSSRNPFRGYLATNGGAHAVTPSSPTSGLSNPQVQGPGDQSTTLREVNIEFFPPKSDVSHPSDYINQFLLEKIPTARVALSHDNDWIKLLQEDDDMFPSAIELRKRLDASFNVSRHEGASILIPKPEVEKDGDGIWKAKVNLAADNSHEPKEDTSAPTITPPDYVTSKVKRILRNDASPAVSNFDWFQGLANGIKDPSELGEMTGIVREEPTESSPSVKRSSWLRKRNVKPTVTLDNMDPFVDSLRQRSKDEIELKQWSFFKEKSHSTPATKYTKRSTPKIPKISWSKSHTWNRNSTISPSLKSPLLKSVVLIIEESWWNDLSGRFRVDPRKMSSVETLVNQPIDLRHTLINYLHDHSRTDIPLVTIQKLSQDDAFFITRRYEQTPSKKPSHVELGISARMIFLAPRRLQQAYTSTNLTSKLETHGLLDPDSQPKTKRPTEKAATHMGKDIDANPPLNVGRKHRWAKESFSREARLLPYRLKERQDLACDDDWLYPDIRKTTSHCDAFSVLPPHIVVSSQRARRRGLFKRPGTVVFTYDTSSSKLGEMPYSPTWITTPPTLTSLPQKGKHYRDYVESKWTRWPSDFIPRPSKQKRLLEIDECPNIFLDVPPNSPCMFLPLWPSKTDPTSHRKFPFYAHVPIEERLYLLLWYTDDLPTQEDSKPGSIKRMKSDGTLHPPLLKQFHFTARVVRHQDLQGTGVRVPSEGIDVIGPLEDAFNSIPINYHNIYGGAQLGQCFGRESGFMFNADALTSLGLCKMATSSDSEMKDGDDLEYEYSLTPIGHGVLEMAWAGAMALTSFGLK